jgi:hypothetical protein
MLTFYPSRIPDPGVKKAPDPGSGSATLTIRFKTLNKMVDGQNNEVEAFSRPEKLSLGFRSFWIGIFLSWFVYITGALRVRTLIRAFSWKATSFAYF